MSKKKPIDKAQARERRNRMLDAAAAAQLSLTEGVREMRAIAGMTQEEFAQHRGVSARVIKAIELGQGNPTVATLNRIGQFFGLEVAFVPIQRAPTAEVQQPPAAVASEHSTGYPMFSLKSLEDIRKAIDQAFEKMDADARMISDAFAKLNASSQDIGPSAGKVEKAVDASSENRGKRRTTIQKK